MNPYEVLGVKQKARYKTIKKAYHAKVKQAHPDMGGSEAEFDLLNRAYIILSNPEMRRHYDRTGEIDTSVVDDTQAKMLGALAWGLVKAVESLDKNGLDPAHEDLALIIAEHLKVQLADIRRQIEPIERTIGHLEVILGRFEPNEGEVNHFDGVAHGYLVDQRRKLVAMQPDLRAFEAAVEIAQHYTYRHKPAPRPGTIRMSMSSTATW